MAKDINNIAPAVTKKNGTVISSHNCQNVWQDERYGFRNRVMNVKANGNLCCVVCAQEKKL